MRSIAIINQKGGVGKTTTAVNLSAALAATGQRVCLIDLDPQAHATLHLGLSPAGQTQSMYDVLTGEANLSDALEQVHESLWVAGSHIDLAAAEVELAGVVGREVILRDKLAEIQDQFDFLFIDCPPSLGVLTLNALAAVDEVFLPLQPHFLALHGLSKLLQTIELVARRLNERLRLTGVVVCMYESGTRLAAEVTSDVGNFFQQSRAPNRPWADAQIFQTRIRRNIRLAEAPSFGQSIFRYAPTLTGRKTTSSSPWRCFRAFRPTRRPASGSVRVFAPAAARRGGRPAADKENPGGRPGACTALHFLAETVSAPRPGTAGRLGNCFCAVAGFSADLPKWQSCSILLPHCRSICDRHARYAAVNRFPASESAGFAALADHVIVRCHAESMAWREENSGNLKVFAGGWPKGHTRGGSADDPC